MPKHGKIRQILTPKWPNKIIAYWISKKGGERETSIEKQNKRKSLLDVFKNCFRKFISQYKPIMFHVPPTRPTWMNFVCHMTSKSTHG